jgi:eukaryotic-like serine/threonine-protein kinase
MVLERGTLLNQRYRIVEILGQGGMGSVYRAIDENLGVEVAVKDNLFTTEEYARQFRLEANILANLRHPNLPRVTDHFVISGQGQYLVMDFIEGEDLRQRMERVGIISEEDAITIGAAVCDALAYLGSRNPPVIHRDLKPGNVKITPRSEIYLVDFGLAKTMHDIQATATGARAMTPGYSPPEQYGTARTDQRSDIYSLGATLYAALTGAIPEDGLARAMDQAKLTPLRKFNPRISRRLTNAIEKSLRIRPDDRFQSAEEFKRALLHASSIPRRKGTESVVSPAPEEERPLPLQSPHVALKEEADADVKVPNGVPMANLSALPAEKPVSPPLPGRRRKVGFWLTAIFIALLLAGFGVYFVAPDAIIDSLSKYIPAFPPGLAALTGTPLTPSSPTPGLPSSTLPAAAVTSRSQPVTPTFSPTRSETPFPTETLTPVPTPLGGASMIAYASTSTGIPQIFVINPDGTSKRQVTELSDGACQPDWSPDGTRLVFITPCKENLSSYPTSSLFIINPDGSGLLPVPKSSGGDFDPAWSPDGKKIAFASTRDSGKPKIFLLDVETKEAVLISELSSFDTQPSWSPDGQQILYISTRGSEQQVWVMDAGGVNKRQVTKNTGYLNFKPSFSPDSKNIIYTQLLRIGSIPILTISPFISNVFAEYRVGQEEPMPMQEGSISPDGLWIVYEGWTGETGHDIYVMTITGLARTRITTDPEIDFDPDWSPPAH